MAFKNIPEQTSVPTSPDKLLLDLPRRKIPDVLPHQREIMRSYASLALEKADVAMQLPTGSGKTLVGLLIAEWRRRKFKEQVVYLCPTNQLVNQVVEQGEEKYGLTAIPFTGTKHKYSAAAKASYQSADRVAVTNYSSLFNIEPYFKTPDVIIVDDAHAAENYIAKMWSIRIERGNPKQEHLHAALRGALRPHLDSTVYNRLSGDGDGDANRTWVDKIPGPTLALMSDELAALMDVHAEDSGIAWEWSILREHLRACSFYLSAHEILLRPLIPPTWTHAPFSRAKQRIYMSATLGAGGDLERLMGRRRIDRLPTPDGWDRHGVGRRFFMFPGMSLSDPEVTNLRDAVIKRAGRSLVLVPNDRMEASIAEHLTSAVGIRVVDASFLERSKTEFVESTDIAAVVANRYDGIDFPGSECRVLCIAGMPTVVNLQERFLMSRMGANLLFNERVQTRVLQAIGRCTRSMEDFSAVIIEGEALSAYLTDNRRRRYFHPELQAEIQFGIAQSRDTSAHEFIENLDVFLANDENWESVNRQIVMTREQATREPFPAINDLAQAVEHEVRYQEALWQGDSIEAAVEGERVLGKLSDTALRGYRAMWHYLAGYAYWLSVDAGHDASLPKCQHHFGEAKKSAVNLPWLVALSRYQKVASPAPSELAPLIASQVERIELELSKLGMLHDRKFSAAEKRILTGLGSNKKGPFEEAHKELGRLLGFESGNEETEGAPDPWWGAGNCWFVFEDHAGAAADSALHVDKARQVATHSNWLRNRLELPATDTVVQILVTPVTKVRSAAVPHLSEVSVWRLSDFRSWASNALALLREARSSYYEPGDFSWRAATRDLLVKGGLDAESLIAARQPGNWELTLTSVA